MDPFKAITLKRKKDTPKQSEPEVKKESPPEPQPDTESKEEKKETAAPEDNFSQSLSTVNAIAAKYKRLYAAYQKAESANKDLRRECAELKDELREKDADAAIAQRRAKHDLAAMADEHEAKIQELKRKARSRIQQLEIENLRGGKADSGSLPKKQKLSSTTSKPIKPKAQAPPPPPPPAQQESDDDAQYKHEEDDDDILSGF